MRSKTLAGALLVAALTFGAPGEARAACITQNANCVTWAWSLDSYWDAFLALDLCYQLYMDCMRQKLVGL